MHQEVDKKYWRSAVDKLPPAARSYVLSTYTFKESWYWLNKEEPLGIGLDLQIFIGDLSFSSGPFISEITEDIRAALARKALSQGFQYPARTKAQADTGLTEKLLAACLSAAVNDEAFLYFKRWSVSGEVRWWKIGITNNIERRESEQNVLPAPEELLSCIICANISQARQLEKAIHWVLKKERVLGASNRELFILTECQESAMLETFEQLANNGLALTRARASVQPGSE